MDAIADEKTGIGRLDHSDWMNYLQAKAVRIKIRGINKNLNKKRVWYANVKVSKYAKRKGIGIIEDEYGVKVTNGVANVIMCNFGFSSTNGQSVKTSDGEKKMTLRKGEPLVVVSVYDEMTDEEIKEDRKVKAMRASLRKKRFNQLKALAMKATECQRESHKTSDGEKTDEVSKDEETNDDIMGFVPQSYFDELRWRSDVVTDESKIEGEEDIIKPTVWIDRKTKQGQEGVIALRRVDQLKVLATKALKCRRNYQRPRHELILMNIKGY